VPDISAGSTTFDHPVRSLNFGGLKLEHGAVLVANGPVAREHGVDRRAREFLEARGCHYWFRPAGWG
jgi:hypothetical protein